MTSEAQHDAAQHVKIYAVKADIARVAKLLNREYARKYPRFGLIEKLKEELARLKNEANE